MTEAELFKKVTPDIAGIIFELQKMKPEQREACKQELTEYVVNRNSAAQGFICKVLVIIDEYFRQNADTQQADLEHIKIYPCFAAHPPKVEKMKQKEQYFTETGLLQSELVLDRHGYLIDGYTSYLIAKAYGIQRLPIRYGRRQVIKAYHKPGGRLYMWSLPEHLTDRAATGDKAFVRTPAGIRTVTVAAMEEYAGQEPEPLRTVIRLKGVAGKKETAKGGCNGQDAV